MPAQVTESTSPESVDRPILNTLGRLFRQVNSRRAVEADFGNALYLLETLPLATDEFGTTSLRLVNAKRYRNETETGAAVWEIGAAMLQLRDNATAQSPTPRRHFLQA
jgi:hypothetical protein